jgi:hypothetical protein
MSHQDRRDPLPAEYQYQPWQHDGRVLKQGEEMLAIWAEYRTLEEALAGMSAVKAQLTADAAAKGLALAGHGPYPGGAYSCRIEDGVRLAVVDGPIEKDNYVAYASAFYVPKVTHGVDCDCPPCRNQFIRVACDLWSEVVEVKNIDRTYQDHFEKPAYGWGV